jgi:tRNA A-37 threonylcarbamoyl transferase component Bud32
MASLGASDSLSSRTGIIRSAHGFTAAFFWALLIFNGFLFLRQSLVLWDYWNDHAATIASFNLLPAIIYAGLAIFIRSLWFLLFAGVALLIYWRRGGEWIGFFVACFFLISPVISDTVNFLIILQGDSISFIGTAFNYPIWWLFYALIALTFPDGRIRPLWAVPIIVVPLVVWQGLYLQMLSYPFDAPQNPIQWDAWGIFLSSIYAITIAIQAYRYNKHYRQEERQQSKWVVIGALGALLVMMYLIIFYDRIPAADPDFYPATFTLWIGTAFVPVGLAISLLRYRLWDADIALNRSLVYGAVAVLLAALFALLTYGIQVLAQTQELIAMIIAGLLAILSFPRLRRFVQTVVDRYLFRLRFNLDQLEAAQRPKHLQKGSLTGQKIEGYKVLEIIGKGGMGEVYRGEGKGRKVAIKTMLQQISPTDNFRRRFQNEVEAGMRLKHPNIANVLASGEFEGVPYFIMDYIEGQNLRQVLEKQGAIDVSSALRILQQLSDSLDYTHHLGYVHRDIKPSNIMLKADGKAILTDLGLIKQSDSQTDLTGTGAIGTIDYMAPEQIKAAHEVDYRADIYSLGIVAYEILTGKKPFEGGAVQMMFAHLQQPPPDAHELKPEISAAMAKAIQKALAKNPKDRFATAGEFMQAMWS